MPVRLPWALAKWMIPHDSTPKTPSWPTSTYLALPKKSPSGPQRLAPPVMMRFLSRPYSPHLSWSAIRIWRRTRLGPDSPERPWKRKIQSLGNTVMLSRCVGSGTSSNSPSATGRPSESVSSIPRTMASSPLFAIGTQSAIRMCRVSSIMTTSDLQRLSAGGPDFIQSKAVRDPPWPAAARDQGRPTVAGVRSGPGSESRPTRT